MSGGGGGILPGAGVGAGGGAGASASARVGAGAEGAAVPAPFDDAARSAILAHMNADHTGDNLLIVRANGAPDAVAATMVDLDRTAGTWRAADAAGAERLVVVAWPTPLTDRRSARVAIVALHDMALSG